MDNVIDLHPYFVPGATPAMVAKARKALHGVRYDTMVGRGLSGALVVPQLAKALRKNYMIVRKPGESTHDSSQAVGKLGKRWLFVDDFVSSGTTRRLTKETVNAVSMLRNFTTEYVGTYEYKDALYGDTPGDDEW